MERLINFPSNPRVTFSLNRVANAAKFWLQEHPEYTESNRIISEDIAYLAQYFSHK